MRSLVTLVVSVVAFAGSAFATNIALNATVSSCSVIGGTDGCSLTGFGAAKAVDGSTSTLWVAPGATAQPYLLVNLGSVVSGISNIQVQGTGNTNLFSAFDVFVSATAPTASNLSSLTNVQSWGTLVLNEPDQLDSSTVWTDVTTGALPSFQYVLYYALNGSDGGHNTGCPVTPCTPGDSNGTVSGQDDAFVNEISVNTPEPATLGLLSFAFLALGFVRRPRK
jgi:hypothetical protein